MKFAFFAAVAVAAALAVAPSAVAFDSNTAAHAKKTATKADKKEELRSRWPAENLSGKIDMVDPSQKLLIVKGDQTIFDFVVTPSTRILDGSKKVKLSDLTASNHAQVNVHFVPERQGDVASTIQLNQ